MYSTAMNFRPAGAAMDPCESDFVGVVAGAQGISESPVTAGEPRSGRIRRTQSSIAPDRQSTAGALPITKYARAYGVHRRRSPWLPLESPADPVAGRELGEQRPVETARRPRVEILDGGILPEVGKLEPRDEPLAFARCTLAEGPKAQACAISLASYPLMVRLLQPAS
jgi:hypothetical protein